MRGIRADQPRLARRRDGADIAAGIGRGQTGGAQAGDHDLREILADALALEERLVRRGVDQGRGRVEGEIVLETAGQRDPRLQCAARGVEIDGAICGDAVIERYQGGGEQVVGRAGGGQIAAGARHRRDLTQCRVAGIGHRHQPVDAHSRPAFNRQAAHRRVDHQPGDVGEARLRQAGAGAADRFDGERVILQHLPGPVDRLQPQIAAREFDVAAIIEPRDVPDIVEHLADHAKVSPPARSGSAPCRK